MRKCVLGSITQMPSYTKMAVWEMYTELEEQIKQVELSIIQDKTKYMWTFRMRHN